MLTRSISLLLTGVSLAATGSHDGAVVADEQVFISFNRDQLPGNMVERNAEAEIVAHKSDRAMKVNFAKVDWPNVFFAPEDGPWDWSAYAGIVVDVLNPGTKAVDVCMRVDDDPSADGMQHCNTGTANVPPGERVRLQVRFNTGDNADFWGMRGVPVRGPAGQGPVINSSHITAFQVFLPRPAEPCTLILKEVRLFGKGGSLKDLVPLPFIDRFGQYKHADWPGKVKNENALAKRARQELKKLASLPHLPGRDSFGGWAQGPQIEATGWFRTECVDGKWWLVTPDGHLFFSNGVDCVGTHEQTFVTGRDGWFEWLPERTDPVYKDLFSPVRGAHSMAEPIGGEGMTFSFYRANLIRKHGAQWPVAWRDTTYKRLAAWGFNTIANWSQEDVLLNSPLPFVGSIGLWGNTPELMGGTGYWGRLKDPFATEFEGAVDKSVASVADKFSANPLCIGYFFDNELSWESIRQGVLASPQDQPARVAFVKVLQGKYGSIEALNASWQTDAKDWDALRVPAKINASCSADLDSFEYTYAHAYFEAVNSAIKKHAPNQLYLGCRFSSAPPNVVRACADVADIVSFNLYSREIDAKRYTGENDLGKPLIIGEFHFGALDRGMFHTGLVATKNQGDRAEHYANYVRKVADCPAFVGCHWFQYVDEPTTGRWFDGENYNIGFVNVTDTPYPELVKAAQKVHEEIYTRRYGSAR